MKRTTLGVQTGRQGRLEPRCGTDAGLTAVKLGDQANLPELRQPTVGASARPIPFAS
jgi:hypothetical protein